MDRLCGCTGAFYRRDRRGLRKGRKGTSVWHRRCAFPARFDWRAKRADSTEGENEVFHPAAVFSAPCETPAASAVKISGFEICRAP
jgi:hypothetical protein